MSTARVIPGDGVRALAAEFAGSALLLAIVVGSGVMGESLSAGVAGLALLANAAATAAGLWVLIVLFARGGIDGLLKTIDQKVRRG